MTELYINQKLNQLAELDYDDFPDNPLEYVDSSTEFFIETQNVTNDLVDNLFDGNEEAYQDEHDKYSNATDLFNGLNKIAKKQGKLIYPVTKYEHSQVRYYLGADSSWDYSVAGFVLVDIKQAKAYCGLNNKTAIENYLDDLLQSYTEYVNGNVYQVVTYQLDSKGEKEESLDCFGGILPDNTNIEQLFDLVFLNGELKDWKQATTQVTTRYIVADN